MLAQSATGPREERNKQHQFVFLIEQKPIKGLTQHFHWQLGVADDDDDDDDDETTTTTTMMMMMMMMILIIAAITFLLRSLNDIVRTSLFIRSTQMYTLKPQKKL